MEAPLSQERGDAELTALDRSLIDEEMVEKKESVGFRNLVNH